jgi:hypothetical protein
MLEIITMNADAKKYGLSEKQSGLVICTLYIITRTRAKGKLFCVHNMKVHGKVHNASMH